MFDFGSKRVFIAFARPGDELRTAPDFRSQAGKRFWAQKAAVHFAAFAAWWHRTLTEKMANSPFGKLGQTRKRVLRTIAKLAMPTGASRLQN